MSVDVRAAEVRAEAFNNRYDAVVPIAGLNKAIWRKTMDEMKLMQKVMRVVNGAWGKLSPAGRRYLKAQLEALDVDAPQVEDVEKERV